MVCMGCMLQLGVVQYEANVLGSRGPRRMQVGLPSVNVDGEPVSAHSHASHNQCQPTPLYDPGCRSYRSTTQTHRARTHVYRLMRSSAMLTRMHMRSCCAQTVFQPLRSRDSMMTKFKKRDFQDIVVAYNKPPRWNDDVSMCVCSPQLCA